jgi:hypothetical protein
MLKFFRKIRQQLLAESKFSKYLIYALGEIVLVVFGILIALQVNNWNIQRNNVLLEKVYVSRLIDELNANIAYFSELETQFNVKSEKLQRILTIWKTDDHPIKDSIQYIGDFISAGDISPWYNEPVTWTQLVQTGDLKVLKDKGIVDELFSYYSLLKKAALNYDGYTYQLVNEARRNWVTPFTVNSFNAAVPPFYHERVPPIAVFQSIEEHLPLYLPLYTSIGITCNLHSNECAGFAKKARELSQELQTYLDQK